jgi:PIN domain
MQRNAIPARILSVAKHQWKRAASAGVDLDALADRLVVALNDVLAVAGVAEAYRNDPSSGVVFLGPPWQWEFTPEDLPVRRGARSLLDQWVELARHALKVAAPEIVAEFDREEPTIRGPLDLSEAAQTPGAGDSLGAAAWVRRALESQREMVARALVSDSAADGELWLIPDTSSLLWNPSLDEWQGDQPATLVLVPQVLRELDHHKQHHRLEDMRRKAEKLLRQFEEYARRGETFVGVPIAGNLRFREIPVDARIGESLSWLQSGHGDDQLLASALDLRWRHPAVSITLVTEDRALRNKARLALIPTDRAPKPEPSKPTIEKAAAPALGPVIRVKAARTTEEHVPTLPPSGGTDSISVLLVTLVNVGDVAGFDIRGPVYFHHSPGGPRQTLEILDVPVIEVDGTYECSFRTRSPAWPRLVGPRNVTIEGTCRDAQNRQYTIG